MTIFVYYILGTIMSFMVGGWFMWVWLAVLAIDLIASSIVFHRNGWSMKKMVENTPAYKKGFKAGKNIGIEEHYDRGRRAGYRFGRYDEFWAKDNEKFTQWAKTEIYPYDN